MKRKRFLRYGLAILLMLSCAVVIATTGQKGSGVFTSAAASEVKSTNVMVQSVDQLTVADVGPTKSDQKKAAAPKKKKKRKAQETPEPEATAEAAPAADFNLDAKTNEFAAAIERTEQDRMAHKKVSDGTKADVLRLKDELVAHYKAKAEAARVAGNPDLVLQCENAIKKYEAVARIVVKDNIESADIEALKTVTNPEYVQYNATLKKQDKQTITAEQKTYLQQRVAAYFQETMRLFLQLLDVVYSLLSQASHAASDPVGFAVGCATTAIVRAAQGQDMVPELTLLRTIVPLLKMSTDNYKMTLANLQALTGEGPGYSGPATASEVDKGWKPPTER